MAANSFFPSRIITLYMARMFLVRTFAVLFALVLVLQTLDLLGASGDVLAYKGNDGGDVLRYVSLRAPQIISLFLPFSVLLGTVITLATLNQNSEVISMKGAGLSAHQVLAPLIVASLFVAGMSFLFNDRIVSRATTTLTRWQKADYGPIPGDAKMQTNVWVREENRLIHADMVTGRGVNARLSDVTIYNRAGGALVDITRSPTAVPVGGALSLAAAEIFDVATGKRTKAGTISVGRNLQPEQFTLASVDPAGMSFKELNEAISDLKSAGRPTASLEAGLWHKISGPLSSILMPLLGAVAAFGIARSGRLFFRAVIGMALGFAYFVADNFGLAMGNLGAYPPLLAAWGPFFLFLLIGETVLIQTEE
jgi:lipopolysaccharide export system permease protein